jgi:type I restriction enzyme M protein
MGASAYKHVVLGPIFLKDVQGAVDARRAVMRDELADDGISSDAAAELLESRDEYAAEGVPWVTLEARWQYLNQRARQPEIGKLVDNAMDFIEVDNPSLRCMVPMTYARHSLDVRGIGELVDADLQHRGKDILGRIYEYFLGWCASAGAKGRGEFCTHQSVDKLLVEMLEPMNRRVYDGCWGSGGVVVQAERFVEVHGGERRAAANIGLEPSHLSHQFRGLGRAGLGPQQQNRHYRHLHPQPPARRGPPHGRSVTAPRGHQRPDGVTDRTANRLRRPVNAHEQG